MTPAGIEPATFRFVAQHFIHCATAVPINLRVVYIKFVCTVQFGFGSDSSSKHHLKTDVR